MSMSKSEGQKESVTANYKVYVHINKINSKKYVGITKQVPEKRWGHGCGYKYNKNTYFWNAIKKYTWDGFAHLILEDNLSFEEAKIKERYYISLYKSNCQEFGYNLTLGGDGFLGMERPVETRMKISASLEGKFVGEKSFNYGRTPTKETIEKQKETKRNNPYHHTAEWKKCHSKQMKGENNVCSRPVVCLNTGERFCNAREAVDYYSSADKSRIHKCCKGLEKSSGKHPITGEKLRWAYCG